MFLNKEFDPKTRQNVDGGVMLIIYNLHSQKLGEYFIFALRIHVFICARVERSPQTNLSPFQCLDLQKYPWLVSRLPRFGSKIWLSSCHQQKCLLNFRHNTANSFIDHQVGSFFNRSPLNRNVVKFHNVVRCRFWLLEASVVTGMIVDWNNSTSAAAHT